MTRETVRLGGGGGGPPWKVIGVGVGGALVVAVVLAIVLWPDQDGAPAASRGCRSDDECKPGSACLAGGCLILLSSEHPGIWHDDVAAQVDAGPAWKPHAAFGEKVLAASRCPARTGAVEKPDESRTTPVLKITVFELVEDGLRVHRQLAAKGQLWLDALRFWFPSGVAIAPERICVSSGVDHVAVGEERWRGKTAGFVDVALERAAPAGRVAVAAVSVHAPLPAADAEGVRTLALGLDKVFDEQMAEHTIVALPLGSDVLALQGPPPTSQRLLRGFVAYYWEHGDRASELALRFRLGPSADRVLDVTQLKP
jgi:hypothetical protein